MLLILILAILGWKTWAEAQKAYVLKTTRRWQFWFEALLTWLIAVPFICFVYVILFAPQAWPPFFIEHHTQQRLALERINSAGGWNALTKDCRRLATEHAELGAHWYSGDNTNFVTYPVIAALRPMMVNYTPTHPVRDSGVGSRVEVVQIRIFGMHATGGHSTPYYGLEVFWGPGAKDYVPSESITALGNRHQHYRKISEDIYEIY